MQRSAPTRIDCLMHASALASMRGDALDATLLELPFFAAYSVESLLASAPVEEAH